MQEILTAAGHSVEVHGLTHPRRLVRIGRLLASGGRPYDLTIFTERIIRGWTELSRRNVLLPNPEWLDVTPAMSGMDAVLCKTRWTTEIMAKLHPRPVFTGFTSLDRSLPMIERSDRRPFHLVGRSPNKGTGAVLEAWRRNPGWPTLTVIAWDTGLVMPEQVPGNVHVTRNFVDDAELQRIQAGSGLHVSPSEAEGFGHTLVEGMSTGALVITTDAPPMNELVTPERGELVPFRHSAPMREGRRFEVDVERLEERIAECLAAPPDSLRAKGAAARKWFEENDAGFRRRLVEVVGELLGKLRPEV
jgi:glycosyltransferase involved in cell wall biosynthesis